VHVRILFGTTTGTSKRWAEEVAKHLAETAGDFTSLNVSIEDLATFPFDTLLSPAKSASGCCSEVPPKEAVVVLLSTCAEGTAPPQCEHFVKLLDDHAYDFRVGAAALAHLGFAVLGFGSSEYEQAGHYCTVAARVDELFAKMSATRLVSLKKVTDTEDPAPQIQPWMGALQFALKRLSTGDVPSAPSAEKQYEYESDDDSISEASAAEQNADDVEDLDETCANPQDANGIEMLTKKHRAQLTKEGYKIVGSHSAVKLCRWTKHQLRGRGGCYKHSFYGITSFQCMEATPSLACANKCVFCWRHHKNPVGTSWKWRMDPPDLIVSEGIEQHRKMIRECKGIPGVKADRFEQAMTVRHCALSLVGEPIMYPRINEMLADLHRRRISTFLVTNAQFPEAVKKLAPITQLYCSLDAATPEDLKAVDRPLFADYWERYLESLRALKAKRQRTVYRLTLVKGHNMASAVDYARLVSLGEPDLIEIKSVTFCGESKASDLNMESVPWHEEVKKFTEAILSSEGLSDSYELACEHQHSCIVLIAHKRYKINGQWHTWIDYDRFHELVEEGRDFDAMEYAAPTPDWALYGSDEAGFDPKETRKYHNRTVKRAKAGLLSEAQLRQYPTNPADA
jgi:tRNA wybutosine-synthesizing protein 1